MRERERAAADFFPPAQTQQKSHRPQKEEHVSLESELALGGR